MCITKVAGLFPCNHQVFISYHNENTEPFTCLWLTKASAVMATGVKRFPDNAQYLPRDSSQQSRGWHSNAFGRALSEAGWLAAAMKSLSNEEMLADQTCSALLHPAPRFIEKSFIIYRLRRAAAICFTAPLCRREVLHDSKCVNMQLLTVAESVTECQVRL